MAEQHLESFGDAQEFREARHQPEHAPVDPRGFEELHAHWPVDQAGLRAYIRALRKQNQRLSYQYLHKQRLYAGLMRRLAAAGCHKKARSHLVAELRVTHGIHRETMTDDQLYERLCSFVEDARAAVTWFNERYVADELQFNLTSEGALETRHDPIEMLREIARCPLSIPPPRPQMDDPDRLRRILLFRMRRDVALAQRLFGIWVFMEQITNGRSFQSLLTDALEQHFFVPGMHRVTEVHVIIRKDSGIPVRIAAEGVNMHLAEGEELVVTPFITRYFRGPAFRQPDAPGDRAEPAERFYPVFYNPAGQKRLWDTLFKMMARGKTDPWMLNDLLRGELVFKNEPQMALGMQALCERVFTMPGVVRGIEDTRLFRPERHQRNPESSQQFRVVRMDLLFHGLPAELQLHSLSNALVSRTSTGAVNHRRYKLRQALRILPILHPREVFWVDWSDPCIRAQVLEG